MEKERKLTFGVLIEELLAAYHEYGEIADSGWSVYFRGTNSIKKTTVCYLAEPVSVTDDYEEIYPEYAQKNKADSYVTDEILTDVLTEYLSEKSSATVNNLIDALNFYLENDTFLDPDAKPDDIYKIPQVFIEREIADKHVFMEIRKAFSVEMPLGAFLKAAQNPPFLITDKLSLADAKRIIRAHNLKEYVTVKYG